VPQSERRLEWREVIHTPSNLKYSDYLQGAAIVTGIVGTSNFVALHGPVDVTGVAILLTTIFAALSQWLQSKGD
jgi:hypothetical protein